MSNIAVVILNYNGRDFLQRYLPYLIDNTSNARLIVVDNGSTDDSVNLIKEDFSEIETIELEKNYGFAGGYNEALQQIDSDYYAIINSDIEVTPDWLTPLLEYLESNLDYAAVQPKIKSIADRSHFDYAGAAGGFVDAMGYPFCRGRIFQHIEVDSGQYDDTQTVDWVSGACMLIRAHEFHKVGGFDDDFFAHMEEIDLCWRIRSDGMKLACIPVSTVYHVGGGTLNQTSPYKTYLNFRNGLSLLVKNLPLHQLIWKLPFRLVLDGIAAIKFTIESSPSHLIAIIKAHFHFYWRIPKNIKKRQNVTSPRSIWLLKEHFMKGKKTFSNLNL